MADVLGCAGEYRAVIHWRAGHAPYTSPSVDALTAVSWNRTANDVSEASITIAKAGAQDCCAQLADLHPWAHELTIYRDADLVWQGPVTSPVRETRDSFVISAQDMLAWLARTVNTTQIRYTSTQPDTQGRHRGPVQWIAWDLLDKNLRGPLSMPADPADILPYVRRYDSEDSVSFEKDGSDNTAVWNEYLLTIFDDELAKRGLEYTTVGRSIILRGPATAKDPAQARLTPDDIAGDIEVTRDGSSAATYAFATSQQQDDISGGLTVGTGTVGTPYGRLDWLVKTSADGVDEDALRQMARQALRGRYPAPTTITIPSGSRLANTAPLTIHQLVPGERIDFVTTGFCMEIMQGFRISDVDVEWGTSGEQVAISLVPLGSHDAMEGAA